VNLVFTPDSVFADFAELRALPFEQHSVTVYGKSYPQPRLTKWYGPIPYPYSGLTLEPAPMPPLIAVIKLCVESVTRTHFNSVLLNLYRDGSDCVGWHSDDEPLFGRDPEVASLSFGATRTFKLRRKDDHRDQRKFSLTHGSLLFMGRGIQQEWQHTLVKTAKPEGERINLTFRYARP
jgi:alkylated DNA repair dioxygenase AlkB